MKVLIACEFSGRVRDAFLALGHDAWSCDIIDSDTPWPCNHIKKDMMEAIYNWKWQWDMMIAFPPCTYLSVAGAGWLSRRPERKQQMVEAALFFKKIWSAPIDKICIENPLMYNDTKAIIGSNYHQRIEPYWFGEPYKKRTCLWLKNLDLLTPTNKVEPTTYWVNSSSNYKKGHKISNAGLHRSKKSRSLTFQGVADAMAMQWGLEL